jgi:hypothetical protein
MSWEQNGQYLALLALLSEWEEGIVLEASMIALESDSLELGEERPGRLAPTRREGAIIGGVGVKKEIEK